MCSPHSGSVLPRHKLVQPQVAVAGSEPGERVGKPGLRIHPVKIAGLDQAGDDGPVIAAVVRAIEQAFSRLRASGLINRSTILLSISIRSSSRSTLPASHNLIWLRSCRLSLSE